MAKLSRWTYALFGATTVLGVAFLCVLGVAFLWWIYPGYGWEKAEVVKTALILRVVTVDFVNKRGEWPSNREDVKAFVHEEARAGSLGYQGSYSWWFERLDRYRVTWISARHPDGSIEMRLTFRGTGPFGWFSQRRDVIIPLDQLEGDVPPLPHLGERRDDVARL